MGRHPRAHASARFARHRCSAPSDAGRIVARIVSPAVIGLETATVEVEVDLLLGRYVVPHGGPPLILADHSEGSHWERTDQEGRRLQVLRATGQPLAWRNAHVDDPKLHHVVRRVNAVKVA